MIDSIKLEADFYGGRVSEATAPLRLNPFPNPSGNASFTFPALGQEEKFRIEVYNCLGEKILSRPYTHQLAVPGQSRGLYFYRVSNGVECYTGQLVVE